MAYQEGTPLCMKLLSSTPPAFRPVASVYSRNCYNNGLQNGLQSRFDVLPPNRFQPLPHFAHLLSEHIRFTSSFPNPSANCPTFYLIGRSAQTDLSGCCQCPTFSLPFLLVHHYGSSEPFSHPLSFLQFTSQDLVQPSDLLWRIVPECVKK